MFTFFCISISWVNKTRLVNLCSCQHNTAVLNQGFNLNTSADDFWKFYLTFVFNFLPNSEFFFDLSKPTGLKQQANLGAGISHVSLNKIHMLRHENEQIVTPIQHMGRAGYGNGFKRGNSSKGASQFSAWCSPSFTSPNIGQTPSKSPDWDLQGFI